MYSAFHFMPTCTCKLFKHRAFNFSLTIYPFPYYNYSTVNIDIQVRFTIRPAGGRLLLQMHGLRSGREEEDAVVGRKNQRWDGGWDERWFMEGGEAVSTFRGVKSMLCDIWIRPECPT